MLHIYVYIKLYPQRKKKKKLSVMNTFSRPFKFVTLTRTVMGTDTHAQNRGQFN